jgi:hypothetical protein
MAILDANLEFSDAQSLIASSAAVVESTNVYDIWEGNATNPNKDAFGNAKAPELGGLVWNCNINTTINAVTIITAKLMTHTAASSIASGTEVASIIFVAAAKAGVKRSFKIPPGTEIAIADRYIGATYTVSGAKCTAGAIDSFLNLDNEAYD